MVSWLAIIDTLIFHAQGYRGLFQIFNNKGGRNGSWPNGTKTSMVQNGYSIKSDRRWMINPQRAYNATQAPNNTPPAVVASAASKGVDICKGRTFPTAALLKKKLQKFQPLLMLVWI